LLDVLSSNQTAIYVPKWSLSGIVGKPMGKFQTSFFFAAWLRISSTADRKGAFIIPASQLPTCKVKKYVFPLYQLARLGSMFSPVGCQSLKVLTPKTVMEKCEV
jgi:hypothetical protein